MPQDRVTTAAPDIPAGLIVLKVDPLSRNVKVDQDPLHLTLRKLREYIKDLNSNSLLGLREEIMDGLLEAKRENEVALGEKVGELEITLQSRFHKAEDAAMSASATVEEMTIKVDDLAKRVEKAMNQAENANEKIAMEVRRVVDALGRDSPESGYSDAIDEEDAPPPMRVTISEHGSKEAPALNDGLIATPSGRSGAQPALAISVPEVDKVATLSVGRTGSKVDEPGGGDDSPVAITHRGSKRGSVLPPSLEKLSTRGSLRPGQLDATKFASTEEITTMKSQLQQLSSDSSDYFIAVEDLTRRMGARETSAAEVFAHQEHMNADLTRRLDELSQLLIAAQTSIDEHGPSISALKVAERELQENKADVTALTDARTELQDALERARRSLTSLDGRATQLESSALQAKQGLLQATQRSDAMQEDQAELKLFLGKKIEDTAAANTRTECNLNEKTLQLAAQSQNFTQHLVNVEAQISHLHSIAGHVPGKAELSELREVQDTLGQLAEGIKDREQAVLFGARCLSCNRVFDDVQQNAGVVNNRAEKQKAQFFAEVQRALHTSQTDPSKSIKMIAVKVGRPGQLQSTGGGGCFEGRDAASVACGVEDVTWVPGVGTSTRRLMPGSRPGTSEAPFRLPPSPPSSAAGKTRPHLPSRPRATPSDFVRGPMDYKHPLSKLLGRSDDESAAS